MNHDMVREAVFGSTTVSFDEGGAWVESQCLYPSNASVVLRVSGGANTFRVSDAAGAIRETTAGGAAVRDVLHWVSRMVTQQGLILSEREIVSPMVSIQELPAALVLVANASQEVAHWLLRNVKIKPSRNFRRDLAELLQRNFGQSLKHNVPLIGASNKPHKFEHIVALPGDRRAVIDPVVNDAASINARVVANLDIKQANIAGLEQRIVFDDQEDWKSADISLLQIGAMVIPFSRVEEVIQRLKAA